MTTKAPKKFPVVPVIFGVVAVALVAVVMLTFEGDASSDQVGSPDVSGDVLPRLPDTGTDPAVGTPIPEVVGADFDGTEVSITDDGNAKIIIFLAHWCPHCQRELPIVQDWLETDPLPDGVDIYAVATGISRTRDNYPPSSWFEREGWDGPVIVDDAGSSVGLSFGLPAYPFWVFADADNNVLARVTGGIAPSDLDNAVATLAATAGG
jgi:cytochrome c biogenesis protein CcmG/thiol:disulfide interchange protein DsbE